MIKHSLTSICFAVVCSSWLAGCATPPPPDEAEPAAIAPAPEQPKVESKRIAAAPSVPAAVAPEPSPSELALASALATYERGEYAAAIRQLTPLTTDNALDRPSQLRALKSLAFSQCLSRALTACRKTFERALKLDGKFDLAPAEQGHPVWGPQFERARKAVAGVKGK